uniref:Putative secreted protein n=1 Tax=Anopheles darlingi TaxID=43151 RepID=A0A2M4D4E0_ANODA
MSTLRGLPLFFLQSSLLSVRRSMVCSLVGTEPPALVRPQPVNRTVAFTGTTFSEYSILLTVLENLIGVARRTRPMSLWN